jgi:gluconokinase
MNLQASASNLQPATMIIILIGVSGAGKTVVGRLLARELGWPFYDADHLHSPENVARMVQGVALTDKERRPWLRAVRQLIERCLKEKRPAVIACSALRQQYRSYLQVGRNEVQFVYLKGDYALIHGRLRQRQDHYMKVDMLAGQFATLEEPHDALTVTVDQEPGAITAKIRQALNLDT